MRRGLRIFLSLFLALSLFGCTQNTLETNINKRIKDWQPDPTVEKSDIVEYEDGNFGKTLGFDVISYPDDASLLPMNFYAIDLWFGQLEYTTNDGRNFVLRVARDNSKDLRESYGEKHYENEKKQTIDNAEVITARSSEKGCTMSYWVKDGFQYSLHSHKKYTPPSEEELERFVKTLETVNANK